MTRSTRAALLLLGSTLVLPLFAFEHTMQSGPPLNQQFPGPNGHANFRKIVAGEFTGNHSLDAVVMDLDQPRLLVSCEYFDTSIGTGAAANDIAVLSGALPGKDVLVTVGAGGLKLCERVSATSSWNVTTVRDETSNWAGAVLAAVGDVNGDGFPDIVGIAANRRDLLYVYGNGTLTFPTDAILVNPSQVIYQLLLMNWTDTNDTPGTVEAVMYSNLGWAVREDNGVFRKSVSWTSSPIHGVVMDVPGTGPDRLINTLVFAGSDRLSISDESRTEGPYILGALGIVGMATGSMSSGADADIDLILTTNTDRDARIYENLSPSSTTFDVANPVKYPFGPSNRNPALNQAGIAVGDFDSDGHPDVLAPAQCNPNPGPLGPFGSIELIRAVPGYDGYRCKISGGHYYEGDPDTIKLTFDAPLNQPAIQPQAGTAQIAELLVCLYYSPGLGQHASLVPIVGHLDIPAPLHHVDWTFELPPNYSVNSSTDFFSIVAFQRTALDGVTIARLPALTGWISPGPNMYIADNTKDTVSSFPFRDIHEEPISASWDQGPTVPPAPAEEEPMEQPGGGG